MSLKAISTSAALEPGPLVTRWRQWVGFADTPEKVHSMAGSAQPVPGLARKFHTKLRRDPICLSQIRLHHEPLSTDLARDYSHAVGRGETP